NRGLYSTCCFPVRLLTSEVEQVRTELFNTIGADLRRDWSYRIEGSCTAQTSQDTGIERLIQLHDDFRTKALFHIREVPINPGMQGRGEITQSPSVSNRTVAIGYFQGSSERPRPDDLDF